MQGVEADKAVELVRQISRMKNVRCEGIFTHYSSAEDEQDFSRAQAGQFATIVAELRALGLCPPLVHANNSAALLHEPSTIYNLIRPGLMMYGIVPAGLRQAASQSAFELASHIYPTLAFKCRVSFVKEVAKGTPLSYGRAFVAPRRMRVATITAGYGDGYLRAGSNRAEVLIHGARCRVLGRITMDQTLTDVSALPRVRAGDEVVLIGKQKQEEITAAELASWCGTIPWEVLTAITYRVPRVYRGGHAA